MDADDATRTAQDKVLARCRKPELVPAITQLRNLFFHPGYNTNVQPADFIAVCEQHMPMA